MNSYNKRIKVATDINERDLKIIDNACKIDKRTRASFLRISAINMADKIMEEKNGN